MAARRLDDKVKLLVQTPGHLKRSFFLIKTIHSVVQDNIIDPKTKKQDKIFWPLELSITAFNLDAGQLGTYWILVDTRESHLKYQ